MRHLRQTALIILFLTLFLHAADKKKRGVMAINPGQTADLEPAKMATARQNCESWALAAGLETLLRRQDVTLDQDYWIARLNGGGLCRPLPALDSLAERINQEITLPDSRHVRLELNVFVGAPISADPLISGIKNQQLWLFVWRGHPYYLTGATWDEQIMVNGQRAFDVKELRLTDTWAKKPDVVFQRGRDDLSEIDGVLTVSVIPQ